MSILISMLLLGSATIANLSYAIDNTHKDFNHIIQQADKPKIQNSIRLSNSINYYTPAPRNERLGGDAYEWNNNTDTAVNLNPDYYYTGSYSGTFHSRITNLTLDTYGYIHDYDYFYFKLLFESNVSVSLVGNSSNYCSFDFFLMQFEYQRINFSYSGNSKANRNLTNIIENVSNDITKSYSGILKPGTYYILSRCKNTQPFGVDITYGLTLDVIKRTATRSNVEITDLKFNRNLGAAVWLADYLPLGFSNIFRPYIIADFYNSQTNGINVEDYALNDLMYIVSSGDYKVAEFYIWDPYIKVALSQVIDETINIVEAEIDNNSKINNQINTTINLIDKTITVACTIVSAAGNLTPYSVAISVASTIINKVSHYFLKFLLNTYLKTNIQTASQYLYYLSKVNSALAVQYTDETKTTVAPEFLTSFSTVALPCFCKFSSSGNSLIPTSIPL